MSKGEGPKTFRIFHTPGHQITDEPSKELDKRVEKINKWMEG